jgi:hypothetical protein
MDDNRQSTDPEDPSANTSIKPPLFGEVSDRRKELLLKDLIMEIDAKRRFYNKRSHNSAKVTYTLLFVVLAIVVFANTIINITERFFSVKDQNKFAKHAVVSYQRRRYNNDSLGYTVIDSTLTIDSPSTSGNSKIIIDVPTHKKNKP